MKVSQFADWTYDRGMAEQTISIRGQQALTFVALLVAAMVKNADLVHYAAPYFEDGAYLLDAWWDPGFSILAPMGGGYIHLATRLTARVLGATVPLEHAALAFVLVAILVRTAAAFAAYMLLRNLLEVSAWRAFLIALASLFIPTASFAMDTLIICLAWNLTFISIVLVSTLDRLRASALVAAMATVALSLFSTVAGAAVAVSLAAALALSLYRSGPARCWPYAVLLAVAVLYFAVGVSYRQLAPGDLAPASVRVWPMVEVFSRVVFERSFVEAIFGHGVRELLAQSSWRNIANIIGCIAIELILIWVIARNWKGPLSRLVWPLTAFVCINVLTAMLVLSGRYHDGYGGTQHYYLQSMLLLLLVGWGAARTPAPIFALGLSIHLVHSISTLGETRVVGILGDLPQNHAAFKTAARAFQSGTCQPCVLSQPAVWAPPWSIRFGRAPAL